MNDLEHKWALVTGASRGVGYQIALGLAAHGCRLVVHARRAEACQPLVDELSARGTTVHAVGFELSQRGTPDALFEAADRLSGGLDVVYNNAAIMTPWCDAHTSPEEDYRMSFEVNVIAPIRICDRTLPGMKKRGFGRVINVTSGIEHIVELMPYSVSKAALDRYVRDVAPSLAGTGVVMSLMDPGWVRTDLGSDRAPNPVESVLPGALVPALLDDGHSSGCLFRAQDDRTESLG